MEDLSLILDLNQSIKPKQKLNDRTRQDVFAAMALLDGPELYQSLLGYNDELKFPVKQAIADWMITADNAAHRIQCIEYLKSVRKDAQPREHIRLLSTLALLRHGVMDSLSSSILQEFLNNETKRNDVSSKIKSIFDLSALGPGISLLLSLKTFLRLLEPKIWDEMKKRLADQIREVATSSDRSQYIDDITQLKNLMCNELWPSSTRDPLLRQNIDKIMPGNTILLEIQETVSHNAPPGSSQSESQASPVFVDESVQVVTDSQPISPTAPDFASDEIGAYAQVGNVEPLAQKHESRSEETVTAPRMNTGIDHDKSERSRGNSQASSSLASHDRRSSIPIASEPHQLSSPKHRDSFHSDVLAFAKHLDRDQREIIDNLTVKFATLNRKIKRLRHDISEKELEVGQKNTQISMLERKIQELLYLKEENNELGKKKDQLKATLTQEREKHNEQELTWIKDRAEFQRCLRELESRNQDLQSKLQNAERALEQEKALSHSTLQDAKHRASTEVQDRVDSLARMVTPILKEIEEFEQISGTLPDRARMLLNIVLKLRNAMRINGVLV